MIVRLSQFWSSLPATSRGIVVMLAATVCFSSMHATIRYLAGELHPFQMAFFRNFFGMIVFLPVIARSGLGFLATTRIDLHLLRAALNIAAMLSFFTAVSTTPLARVTALSFTSPIFMAALAVLLLGERIYLRRTIAIAGGFLGMLIVIRPGLADVDTGSLLALFSAAVWAVAMIVIKVLSRTDSSLTITGYMTVLLSLLSLPPAVMVWRDPSPAAWALLVFIGISGTFAQILLAEAISQADAGVVMPFDFLKLVWATLFGFLLFTELPDLWTVVGAVVIFASGTYIAYRETRAARRAAPK